MKKLVTLLLLSLAMNSFALSLGETINQDKPSNESSNSGPDQGNCGSKR